MTPHANYIQTVIDKALNFSNSHLLGLQEPVYFVPQNMIDITKSSSEKDIVFWKPIKADIPEKRFKEYENKIGYSLPDTYKDFLSYKYFVSLNFGHEAIFFQHTESWVEDYYDNILKAGIEDTLGEGFIPFARDTDRGYFCFDTKVAETDNEYKIVIYSPEFGTTKYQSIKRQFTFIDFVHDLETRLDKWAQVTKASA
ncbi:MAG: SMI1/KNR4 family protein [Bacteroidetes bacterium]|nr:SMI1/KNR4 family protein [Bacteroidota bacterium]